MELSHEFLHAYQNSGDKERWRVKRVNEQEIHKGASGGQWWGVALHWMFKCMWTKMWMTILKADVNEEGQAFLYCEKCWEEFYDEKFDGTRLSSLNGNGKMEYM